MAYTKCISDNEKYRVFVELWDLNPDTNEIIPKNLIFRREIKSKEYPATRKPLTVSATRGGRKYKFVIHSYERTA